MSERFDVVIVGARCAGSSLAIHLARNGLRVAVVDRARFPSDTPSTHFFQADGIAALHRLGVLDALRSTGAPFVERAHFRLGDIIRDVAWPSRPDDHGAAMSVRRLVLDSILIDAAQEAGAELHTSMRVTGLLQDGGRVHGVRAVTQRHDRELRGDLVIGADGRRSTVAKLVNARMYNVVRSERFVAWAYYDGVHIEKPAASWLQRWDDEFVIGFPCDSGLFLVAVGPPLARLAEFRADAEKAFDAHVRRCEPLAAILTAPGVRRVGRLRHKTNFDGHLRESAGPGWALVGDAGHFKDPSPAQGISDALRQVDHLAPAVVARLGGGQSAEDALADWWRWRDQDAAEHYWFATVLGRAGAVPAVFVEAVREIMDSPAATRRFLDIFNHRTMPSDIFTPALIGSAAWRVMKAGPPSRRLVVSELRRLASDDARRRALKKRRKYADTRRDATPSRSQPVLDRRAARDGTGNQPSGDATASPADVVLRLLGLLQAGDVEAATDLLAPGVSYANVSLPTIVGRENVRRVLRTALRPRAKFEVHIHSVAVAGQTVLTERTDALLYGPMRVQFWVCGRFDIVDGNVVLWKDYFDWASFLVAILRGLLGVVVPVPRPALPVNRSRRM